MVSEDISEILEPEKFSLRRKTFRSLINETLEDAPEYITILSENLKTFTFAYDAKTIKCRSGEGILSNCGNSPSGRRCKFVLLVENMQLKTFVLTDIQQYHLDLSKNGDKTAESLFLTLSAMVASFVPDVKL